MTRPGRSGEIGGKAIEDQSRMFQLKIYNFWAFAAFDVFFEYAILDSFHQVALIGASRPF